MKAKFRIGILGLGGVGGYFGGKLAGHYSGSTDVDIIFIARGDHARAVEFHGLKLISSEGETIVRPSLVSNDPERIGTIDLMICCLKSYDLESSLKPLRACFKDTTLMLPLLNGVDASERIKNLFPFAQVWDGCAYLISRLTAPGTVTQTGNINSLIFGSVAAPPEMLKSVEIMIRAAGINARVSNDILQTMWEKFLFISVLASLTSYLDCSVGAILENKLHRALLTDLLNELKVVADAKRIPLSDGIVQKTLDRMESLPYEATSSMHSDFQKGGRTEVESLTGYVVRLGREMKIPTPRYEKILGYLKRKESPV